MKDGWRSHALHLGIALAVLAVAGLALTGCFGGGGLATGSVDGYVFKPEGRAFGNLKIAPVPEPPEGYVPCAGATVTVTGSSNVATTNASGYFRVDNVSPGYQTITIVYGSYTLNVGVQVTAGRVTAVNPLTGSILPKKWTIMVYMCADNDLDSAALEDVNEMELLGSNNDVNILVQIDRPGVATGVMGQWKGARRYYIRQDPNLSAVNSPVVYWFGPDGTDNEIDMGDPYELRDFVQWVVTYYPAQHYMLVLWNHGNGWTMMRPSRVTTRAVCGDDTGTWLDIDQVPKALDGLPHLDIIGLDACVMQMIEVAYEFRNLADIMVGSEETEPADGWEYQNALAQLCANPDRSAWNLAKDIVDTYLARHGGSATQSAFWLSYADDVAMAIRDLKDILISYLRPGGAEAAAINQAMIDAMSDATRYGSIGNYSFYDIYEYVDGLKTRVNIYGGISSGAKAAISSACDAVKSWISSSSVYAPRSSTGKGLSIYIPDPAGSPDANYDWLQFDWDTKWSDIFSYY